MRARLPGLGALCLVASGAAVLTHFVPGVNRLLVAIFIGATIANVAGVPQRLQAGLSSHKLLLEVGIVLMGVQLSLDSILQSGPVLVGLVIGSIAVGILVVEATARLVIGSRGKTTSLLAAGASVCGVSAVVAVAGAIDADEGQIAYAVGTVLLFDAITLVVFPIVGNVLGLSPARFGVWAGLSMFSTGPVTAVGFAYAETAGQLATLTKLVRNSFIGVVAIGYSLYWVRDAASDATRPSVLGTVWGKFPKFLVGFLVVIVIANVVSLSSSTVATVDSISGACFLLAFAGLGFDIRLDSLRAVGKLPLVVVGVHLLVIASLTLGATVILF